MAKLWEVVHKSFQTDDIGYTTDVFKADTKEEVREMYKTLQKLRKEYPYCWGETCSISRLKVISSKTVAAVVAKKTMTAAVFDARVIAARKKKYGK